jgi:4-oxalocrotonate tautomerase
MGDSGRFRSIRPHASQGLGVNPYLNPKEIAGAQERTMPLVTIKVFKDELSNSQAKDLIGKVTEAVIPFVGEKLRDNTWVLIEEIASGSWGIGGKTVGLEDVRAIQSQE